LGGLNQGFFKALYINEEGEVERVELTELSASLLAEALVERIEAEREGGTYHRRAGDEERSEPREGADRSDELSLWVDSNERTVVALAAALSNPCWEAKRLLGLTPERNKNNEHNFRPKEGREIHRWACRV
jgi:hypothetical protein